MSDEETLISEHTPTDGPEDEAEKTVPQRAAASGSEPAEELDPLVGTEFVGKYHILKILGRGGMGAVYLAEHTRMQRKVAIKMMHSGLAEDPSLLKRFEQEAQVASKLSHKNAVTLYDFGVESGTPYLVMEFVQGHTLKELLAAKAPLSVEQTLGLLEQVCGALSQAHRLGIVHRDLKPDNIVLALDDAGEECPKILDFGISKLLDSGNEQDSGATDLTKTGIVIGTPKYLSPEQAKGASIDARSDIYSLGIITYEMLGGASPFDAGSVMEVIAMHLNTVPKPLSSLATQPPVPDKVSEVVASALEKDPNKRPATVDAYIEQLRAAAPLRASSPMRILRTAGVVLALLLLGAFAWKWFAPAEQTTIVSPPVPAPESDSEPKQPEPQAEPEESPEEIVPEEPEQTPDEVPVEPDPEPTPIQSAAEPQQSPDSTKDETAAEPKEAPEPKSETLTEVETNELAPTQESKAVTLPDPDLDPNPNPKPNPLITPTPEKTPSPSTPTQEIVPGYYIEAAKFTSKQEAEALAAQFRAQGYLTLIEETANGAKRPFLLYVGRFDSMFSAMRDAKKVADLSGVKRAVTVVKQKP